ncbi:MAG: helix-turn-helix transcriptional regulator [Oscillospiraceae bacterium]|nr:helix-turn-helix transcriptional regulator [Oscillospiraceae bacterium]
MTGAYDKNYLEKARTNLGRMLDFAVYDLKLDLKDFFDRFIISGLASTFENGDSKTIAGKSGVELAYEVLEKTGENARNIKPRYTADRSEEYWTGWAIAYYQWKMSISFAEIVKYIPIVQIKALYSPYHEMDIRHFVDKMNELYNMAKPETNLKIYRKRANLSQKQLAELVDIPVRMIQHYEQRQKNINKAQTEYLVRLSKVLNCDIKDLLELIY